MTKMMKRSLISLFIWLITLTFLFISQALRADDLDDSVGVTTEGSGSKEAAPNDGKEEDGLLPVRTPGKRKMLKPAKRAKKLASLDKQLADEERIQNGSVNGNEKLFEIRLGGLAGLTNVSNSNATTQATRTADNQANNLYLGANVDMKFYKYFGFEAEGFYGIAPAPAVSTEATLNQIGGIAAAKLQLPLMWGNVKIIPKIGGGFGYEGLNSTTSVSGSIGYASSTSTLSVYGPAGVLGVDIEPGQSFLISTDFAMSIGATGTYSTGTSGSFTNGTSPSFERFRAGAYYRLSPIILVGGQFIQRNMTATFTTGSFATPIQSENQTQILGVFMLEL